MARQANPLKLLASQSPDFADIADRVSKSIQSYVDAGKDDAEKQVRFVKAQALFPLATEACIRAMKGK